MTHEPHISAYKRNEVEEVRNLVNEYPVIAVLNLEGLPAMNYQEIKHKIKDKAKIKFTKKSFMIKALEQIKKPNIDVIKESLHGVPALMFTREDPFSIYKVLEKSKVSAPAKAGQKAPNDISIPAGPTPFSAGPMIGEFGQLGIKTEVKEGKISIKEDKLLLKEGDEIKPKVADLLAKLGIEPMRIGINLTLAYENGMIYRKDVLGVSEEEYISNIRLGSSQAFNLAMLISYTTKDTIQAQLLKAYCEAKSLAEKANLPSSESVEKEIVQAEVAAESIAKSIPEEVLNPEATANVEVQEIKQEAPKQEVPKAELPKEEPVKQEVHKDIPKVEHIHKEAPIADVSIESKIEINQEDMKTAEKVLNEMYDKAVKIERKEPVEKKEFQKQETDINKIINSLKDRKSRGEL